MVQPKPEGQEHGHLKDGKFSFLMTCQEGPMRKGGRVDPSCALSRLVALAVTIANGHHLHGP